MKQHPDRARRTALPLAVVLALVLLAACSVPAQRAGDPVPAEPPFLFELDDQTLAVLEEDDDVREELQEVLTAWFGTRYAPELRVLPEWRRIGFDPNATPFESAPFGADLEGRRPEALRADNRRVFARELRALEDGGRIGPFRRRPDLTRGWRELERSRRSLSAQEFRASATHFFVDRYPDLAEGAVLFSNTCARCHGRGGAGDGPMSTRLVPRPRDYRKGVFKFAAVERPSKPRRADLLRTLVHGLPGSAMPSFRDWPLVELNAFVDQVRLLAVRGEVEARLLFEWEDAEVRPSEAIEEVYRETWSDWLDAAGREVCVSAPPPVAEPERWERGRALFLDTGAVGCVRCHGPEGRGDGPSAIEVDASGERRALLRDEWGNSIVPRDLTSGVFRGGGEREDVYLRVHCGIPGTPMPSFEGTLADEDAWALVDYVLSLSGRGPLAAFAR